jgi:HD superfamily phosphodiesterase
MTEQQIKRIRKWWHDYVRRFDAGDADLRRNMHLKEAHTLRVCREAASIGKALAISAEDLRLTEALVLLHDVGRFEQYARYRTFADRLSENHALLGLKILRQEKVLSDLPARTQSILRRAIQYHNQARIPPVKDRRLLFFARLLRDADKLDIWRLMIDYSNSPPGRKNHAITIGLAEGRGVTPAVMEDLREQRIVDRKHVQNLNDFKLLQLGWVFDVNFLPTLRAVQRRGYLEKLRETMPEGAETVEAYKIARRYVVQRTVRER